MEDLIRWGWSVPTCVVVDTETTGIRAADDRVIEIGAVRIRDGEVAERFESLVNPGVSVPWRITRLTGISSRDLASAPGPEEVWARFLEFSGDAPLVAHHAQFDRGFVHNELRRLGLVPPSVDWLCTVKLSRRLLPGLTSYGLGSVARFLGVSVGTRHRALADAEITAEVVLELASRAAEQGFEGMTGMLALQGARYSATGAVPRHVETLRREVVPHLPEGPGVYRLLDGRKKVLYVGKATSLRERVGSYFVAVQAKELHLRELVRRTRTIEVLETQTEIEARVLEARTIQALLPPYNRAQREPGRRAWLRLAEEDGRPTVSVHAWRGQDAAEWIGPLSGSTEARGLAEAIAAVTGATVDRPRPRSTWSREAAAQVARAAGRVGAVVGDREVRSGWNPEILPELARPAIEEAMHRASEELAFEEARILRDWLEGLERLEAEGCAADRLAGDVAAVSVGERVEIVLIRDGRMLGSCAWSRSDPGPEALRSGLVLDLLGSRGSSRVFEAGGPVARRTRNDETWMLAKWIGRGERQTVVRGVNETDDAFVVRLLRMAGEDPARDAGRTDSNDRHKGAAA